MKRIDKKINSYCTYCKEAGREKVRAVWRISYVFDKRACDEHKPLLEEYERKRRQLDGGDYSEADYQTWVKL